MEEKKAQNRVIINIGTSLMVVILIGLSFAVIAALTISSSYNNFNLTKLLEQRTNEYYTASNKANEIIADKNWEDMEFEVYIDENQKLFVQTKDKKIIKWQVVNVGKWEAESSQPVLKH